MNPNMIDHPIPRQHYELLRDAIGAILKIELDNKGQADAMLANIAITSTAKPIDEQELPLINVLVASGNMESKDPSGVSADYFFFVDVYVSSVEGEEASVVVRDRIAGAVRYILDHPNYDRFAFDTYVVKTSKVSGIQFTTDKQPNELNNITAARISLEVSVQENNVLDDAPIVSAATTLVRLQLTDKGYRYAYVV